MTKFRKFLVAGFVIAVGAWGFADLADRVCQWAARKVRE